MNISGINVLIKRSLWSRFAHHQIHRYSNFEHARFVLSELFLFSLLVFFFFGPQWQACENSRMDVY
jgi:hypothetical protein